MGTASLHFAGSIPELPGDWMGRPLFSCAMDFTLAGQWACAESESGLWGKPKDRIAKGSRQKWGHGHPDDRSGPGRERVSGLCAHIFQRPVWRIYSRGVPGWSIHEFHPSGRISAQCEVAGVWPAKQNLWNRKCSWRKPGMGPSNGNPLFWRSLDAATGIYLHLYKPHPVAGPAPGHDFRDHFGCFAFIEHPFCRRGPGEPKKSGTGQ